MSNYNVEITAGVPTHVCYLFSEKFDPGSDVGASGIGPVYVGAKFRIQQEEAANDFHVATPDYFDDKLSVYRVVFSGSQEGLTSDISKPVGDPAQCLIYSSPGKEDGSGFTNFDFTFFVACSGTGGARQFTSGDRSTVIQTSSYLVFDIHFSGVDTFETDDTVSGLIDINKYSSIADGSRVHNEGDPYLGLDFSGVVTVVEL